MVRLPLKWNPRAHKRFADTQPLQRLGRATVPLGTPLVAHIADVLHPNSARPESRRSHVPQKTKKTHALAHFRLGLCRKRNFIQNRRLLSGSKCNEAITEA